MIEIGMPYSDPIADGPVIQQSNLVALQNGMTMELLFRQLNEIKKQLTVPVILMGYLNPVLQYGMDRFCADAANAGVDAVILPDLPMYEFETYYKKIFEKNNLHAVFLITPETSEQRIRMADKLSSGFLYAVSSSATTGNTEGISSNEKYLKKLAAMKLKNPYLIGFGINDRDGFENACSYASGAIIGSAYIKALMNNTGNTDQTTALFIRGIKPIIE
jgi:tryptophan synthase alpha chain